MRCPLRTGMHDQPDRCDPECAWALRAGLVGAGAGYVESTSCAVAVAASALCDQAGGAADMAVPYMEEER